MPVLGTPIAKFTDIHGANTTGYTAFEKQPVLFFGNYSENVSRFRLDYGDGIVNEECLRHAHQYLNAGVYVATLTVWNDLNESHSVSVGIVASGITNRAAEYVTSMAQIQTIINTYSANPSGLPPHIKIASGSTLLGNLTLPLRTWNGFILIESDGDFFDIYERIQPGDARLVKMIANANTTPVIDGNLQNRGGFYFRGIEFGANRAQPCLVDLSQTFNNHAAIGRNYIFQHCASNTGAAYRIQRAIYNGAEDTTFIGCTFKGVISASGDCQAICWITGNGRSSVFNCDLRATSENIMTGGDSSYMRTQTTITATSTTTQLKVGSVANAFIGNVVAVHHAVDANYTRGMVWTNIKAIDVATNTLTVDAIPFVPDLTTKVNFGTCPSDIEFRYCIFPKDVAWKGVYGVKNNFEIKHGDRIIAKKCIFRTMWRSEQWTGLNVKSTPQHAWGAGVEYTCCRNIHFVDSRLDDMHTDLGTMYAVTLAYDGYGNLGASNPHISMPTENIVFTNFLVEGATYSFIMTGSNKVKFNKVTAVKSLYFGLYFEGPCLDMEIKDSIVEHGLISPTGYGNNVVNVEGGGSTTTNKFAYITNRSSESSYPNTANSMKLGDVAAAGFTNYAAGNYQLSESSPLAAYATDGGAVGVDWSKMVSETVATGTIAAPNEGGSGGGIPATCATIFTWENHQITNL
jgi:hypothetical protein